MVLLNSASYLFAGAMIVLLSVTSEHSHVGSDLSEATRSRWATFWGEWQAGLQIVGRDRLIAVLFAVVGIFALAASITNVLLVAFVHDVLRGGAVTFGWLLTVRGVGGLIGGVIIGRLKSGIRPAHLLALSLFANGGLMLVMFNFPFIPVALVLFALGGIPQIGYVVSQQTLLQRAVADKHRGRVFGALGATSALLDLAGLSFGGTFGDRLGVAPVLNVAGGLWLIAGVIVLLLLPRSRDSSL